MNLTQIHQIEVTTRCNLRCRYCPHPGLEREKEDMDWSTFLDTISLVKHYDKAGTQGEISFTGLGEATLHPRFIDMLYYTRDNLPHQYLCFSTNGLPSFTEEIAKACAEIKVDVFVSLHRPEVAVHAVNLCKDYGIFKNTNVSAVERSFNWAGQLDWPVTAENIACDYLKRGWGVVLVDGRISTCCLDAHGKQIIGRVDDPLPIETAPGPLCENCHMVKP